MRLMQTATLLHHAHAWKLRTMFLFDKATGAVYSLGQQFDAQDAGAACSLEWDVFSRGGGPWACADKEVSLKSCLRPGRVGL